MIFLLNFLYNTQNKIGLKYHGRFRLMNFFFMDGFVLPWMVHGGPSQGSFTSLVRRKATRNVHESFQKGKKKKKKKKSQSYLACVVTIAILLLKEHRYFFFFRETFHCLLLHHHHHQISANYCRKQEKKRRQRDEESTTTLKHYMYVLSDRVPHFSPSFFPSSILTVLISPLPPSHLRPPDARHIYILDVKFDVFFSSFSLPI